MGRTILPCLVILLCAVPAAVGAEPAGREVVLGVGEPSRAGIPDLLEPEGKSRWDLTAFRPASTLIRSFRSTTGSVKVFETAAGETAAVGSYTGRFDSDAAARWLFPERYGDLMRPGAKGVLDLEVRSGTGSRDLRILLETRGIGWVLLPSGPREAVLQRALILPDNRLVHRWVDPRAGVVAEVGGPASDDGRSRISVDRTEVVEDVLAGAADLKIYIPQLIATKYTRLNYSWDTGEGTPVSSLTPDGYATIGDLIAADSWAFTEDYTAGVEVASTLADVNSDETCNMDAGGATGSCGYPGPGKVLEREDINFPDVDPTKIIKNNQVVEREDRATDVTFWLRAGAQKEGKEGLFGDGESRMCYISDAQETRTPVPLWRFSHQDADGWYLQAGDSWGAVFNTDPEQCEQNIFNQVCGESGFMDELYMKTCTGNDGKVHHGEQTGEVIKGGVVTLPSGHTLNALLVRTMADFCVYNPLFGRTCNDGLLGNKVDEVRTVVYLWQVPHLGSVVLLQSEQDAPDTTTFTFVDTTHISFGLYPPLSVTVDATTDNTIEVSWNPGNDSRRIDDYKIYWGVASGSSSEYPFDSESCPGRVSFNGTGATISDVGSGTTYFVTVTSRSTYANPSTGDPVLYESILYPTQVSGDPDHVYPVEVLADTTGSPCIPTQLVETLSVDKLPDGTPEFCWSDVEEACEIGYRLMGANSPELQGNFTQVAETGPNVTCWTGDPSETYFLAVVKGSGGDGPWGHYEP